MKQSANITHLVSYQQSHVVGYDVELEGIPHFFTTEALHLALNRGDFLLDRWDMLQEIDFPQRDLSEQAYENHPTLSNLEKIELLQGAQLGRRYVYDRDEVGDYVATIYHGNLPCLYQPLPFWQGNPVLSLVGLFDAPEDCQLPFWPAHMEQSLLAVEQEGGLSPVSLRTKKPEIPPRTWEKSQDLREISLLSPLFRVGERAFSACPKLKDLSLPETLVHLEEEAFSGTALTKVVLPQGLETLGPWTFSYCAQLGEITLPNHLKRMEKGVFIACHSLKQVILPENLEEIGEKAFYGSGLTELILPEGLREIGPEAFAHCKDLKRVQFPHSLEKIHPSAFAHSGIQEIILKEGLDSLGTSAFAHCTQLKQVSLPSHLRVMGNSAFQGCIHLEKVRFTACFATPPKASYLGASAFAQSGVQEIDLPDFMVELEEKAFYECKQLWKVSLPSQLKELGDAAFAGTGLLEIALPDSLEIMGEDVFLDCPCQGMVDFARETL